MPKDKLTLADKWILSKVNTLATEVTDNMDRYELGIAVQKVYDFIWEEFCDWYIEMVKPRLYSETDETKGAALWTLKTVLGNALKLLHPFMPFITEELWQHLAERKEGESIMTARMPEPKAYDSALIERFETAKQIIAGIRTIRLQKNIPNKEPLSLQIIGSHNNSLDCVIVKLTNLSAIETVTEKDATAASFLVGTTEYAVPLGNNIDVEAELKKLNDELKYMQGFLKTVLGKLSNERFVQNAPAAVVEMERKKQADAESKIKSLEESIAALKQ